jgi:hypothetical protein
MYLQLEPNVQKTLKKKNFFCWHLESHWRKEQYPDLEPVTDRNPVYRSKEIRVRLKLSRIRYTGYSEYKASIVGNQYILLRMRTFVKLVK